MTAVGAFFGVGAGLGLWLFIRAYRRGPAPLRRLRPPGDRQAGGRPFRRCAVAVGCGLLVGVATGWPVGAALAAAAAWALPRALGPDREHAARVARHEAVAGWAEMLRDTLSAAAGLEQAIIVTAPLAADPIREPLRGAAAKLRSGRRLAPALRELADDLADPTADLVIAALLMAAERHARNLADLLGSLADAARDHAALGMAIHAERAQIRSEVRITIGTTLVFAGGLILLDRAYLNAYDTAAGQLVLFAVGALFAGGFWALTRISRVREPARLLNPTDTARPAADAPDGVDAARGGPR